MRTTKQAGTSSSITNMLDFWYKNKMLNVNTIIPVSVIAVNSDGTVDVEVMVLGLDADNKAMEPIKIYNSPILTLSAGKGSIEISPVEGDVGLMAFCQRDISTIVNTKKQGIPSTLRRFSLSDGIYLGSILYNQDDAINKVVITDEEIQIKTEKSTITIANAIVFETDNIDFTANMDITMDGESISIEGSKVVTTASSVNAITELKDVCNKLATACSLPTAPGQPVLLPPDLILIQTALSKLGVFE